MNIHTVTIKDRTYAIIQSLNYSVMESYDIWVSDQYYSDFVSGPYLTIEEAIKDFHSAVDRHEQINCRPTQKNA